MQKFSTTLSSKNQITLPVAVLQQLGWNSGQKISILLQNNSLIVQNYEDILDDIQDIVSQYKLPKISINQAVKQTHKTLNKTKYHYDN